MTTDELTILKDILQWAKPLVKTDGMYVRLKIALTWIDRDITLKTMDPRKYDKD